MTAPKWHYHTDPLIPFKRATDSVETVIYGKKLWEQSTITTAYREGCGWCPDGFYCGYDINSGGGSYFGVGYPTLYGPFSTRQKAHLAALGLMRDYVESREDWPLRRQILQAIAAEFNKHLQPTLF